MYGTSSLPRCMQAKILIKHGKFSPYPSKNLTEQRCNTENFNKNKQIAFEELDFRGTII